jgi:hypothetical protein
VAAQDSQRIRFVLLWQDQLLQQEGARPRPVILLDEAAHHARIDQLHQPSPFQQLQVMADLRRVLSQDFAQLRERSRLRHQQAQDRHPAGVAQNLDMLQVLDALQVFHGSPLEKILMLRVVYHSRPPG